MSLPAAEPDRSTMVRCSHCLLELCRNSAIVREEAGHTLYFCCKGCLGVYELIHHESLDAFYRQRCDWHPGTPAFISIDPAPFRELATTRGKYLHIDLLLSGIRCASCVWLVENYLMKLEGVVSARVNYATRHAVIEWSADTILLDAILDALSSIGYLPRPADAPGALDIFARERQELLLRFGTAAFFSMQLMLFTAALYAGFFQGMETRYKLAFQLISWVLATPVLFYSGYPFLAGALRSVKASVLTMDLLVALGSLSAYLYSIAMIVQKGEVFFDTSAMIITFILLGRFLEAGSRLRAGSAIAALAELQPKEALLVNPETGERSPVPLDRLHAGDQVEVLPGGRIPVDGTVTEGHAETDESMLTGESCPVLKTAGSTVYAGTISINGHLRISITGDAGATLLSKIISTVQDSQARKAPIQNIADKTASAFVPAILFLSACTFLYWFFYGAGMATALLNGVSVLVVACPCALGLATPLAILVGTTSAGRQGLLVKGGDLFEAAARTTTVVFDKTGTLTRGKPTVTDQFDFGVSEHFLQHCASLETWSEHPAGKAIAEAWKGNLLPVTQFIAIPGMGVSGSIDGASWHAGSAAHIERQGIAIPPDYRLTADKLGQSGKTPVFVACGNALAGLFGLIDDIRDEAAEMAAMLKAEGLRLMIVTGDNEGVARYIAGRCGITEIQSGIGPLEKTDIIRTLKNKGETVMMVGDGINDAPALTEASVGVTLGQATGIALESAGVAIINDDLRHVATLFRQSRTCFTIIRQNLAWAFSYNLIALPLAVSGFLHPVASALLMASSSLVVVGNSLRLQSHPFRSVCNPPVSLPWKAPST